MSFKRIFVPTEEHYQAMSKAFKNDVKAYIVPVGKEYMIELDWKGTVKQGRQIFEKQDHANEALWNLYLEIVKKLK